LPSPERSFGVVAFDVRSIEPEEVSQDFSGMFTEQR
jgi:hypothetical protein